MSTNDKKLIKILHYMHMLCDARGDLIRESIPMYANKALDAGFWSEAFRFLLYDGNTSIDDLKIILKSHLTELGHEFDGHKNIQPAYCEVSFYLHKLLDDDVDELKTAHYVLLNLYCSELYNDRCFLHLRAFEGAYYQWWAGDSEWMLGEQLEEARRNAISNLKTEARHWLDKHGVANPFEGL